MEKWKRLIGLKIEKKDISQSIDLVKFTEDALNASISLRKLKQIDIIEKDLIYHPRPQLNIMLCKLFGSDKSSILKRILSFLGEDYISRDDFTKPSFLGTIDRNRTYINGIIAICGGKILGIDEWNNLDSETRESMLTTLENQHVSRSLGFRVKLPVIIKDDFTDITVEEGSIEGKSQFTVIAMAMSLTSYSSTKDKALISRFRLIQHYNSIDEMKKINAGELSYRIKDYMQPIELVTVTQNTWKKFVYNFHDSLKEKGLYPLKDDYGYVNRTSIDILHDAIYNRMKKETCDKKITIDNEEELIKYIPNGEIQLRMYSHKEKSTYEQFIDLINNYPNRGYKWYCEQLEIKKSQLYNLVKKYESNTDKKISLIDNPEDDNGGEK